MSGTTVSFRAPDEPIGEIVESMKVVFAVLRKRYTAEEAEDGTQHAALKALEAIQTDKKIQSIRAWMVEAGWNHLRGRHRHQEIEAKHTKAILRAKSRDSVEPVVELLEREESETLKSEMATLPEHYRDVLLRILSYETVSEIAETCEVTPTAIYSRIRKAIRLLKTNVESRTEECTR